MAATAVITSRTKLSQALGSAEFLSDAFLTALAAQLLALEPVKLASQAVTFAAPVTLPHGLGRVPNSISLVPQTGVLVFQQAAADATNIYLQSVTSNVNVDVYLT